MSGFMERLFILASIVVLPMAFAAMLSPEVDAVWRSFVIVFAVLLWVALMVAIYRHDTRAAKALRLKLEHIAARTPTRPGR